MPPDHAPAATSPPGPARRRWLAAAGAALWAPALRSQGAALRLGLAPYLSPAALLATFRPVREQLAAALGEPVELYTARDFDALVQSVRRVDYDIALLPAHLGLLAIGDWGWQPLARTVTSTEVLLFVHKDDPAREAAALRGRRIGMLDPQSLTALVALHWLQQHGLGEPALQVAVLPSFNSALHALDRGEVAAVVGAASQLHGLPPQTPRSERVLARLGEIPGPVYVARPGTPAPTLARWRTALLAFAPDPQRPATAANARLSPLEASHLSALAPFAAAARASLAADAPR